MSTLRAEIRCERPDVQARFEVADGSTLAVLGRNGAGKSTVLSVVAGLRRAAGSTVAYGEQTLEGGRVHVPPHRRPVVLMSQHGGLFPHLSVRANVAFGPQAAGLSRDEVAARVQRWLSATGVADLADRRPDQLSGGQTQRVTLARALAAEPAVLLLDEPFSALDVAVAQEIRALVRSLVAERDGVTVLVTHDLLDAVGLADQVVVMDAGRIVESGATLDVLAHPRTSFTATMAGMNLVLGRFDDGFVQASNGIRVVGTPVAAPGTGSLAAAAFSPRAVAVYLEEPHGSPRNILRGTVVEVTARDDHALVRVDCDGQAVAAEVTWAAIADLGLVVGKTVALAVKATEVRIYDVDTQPGSVGRGQLPAV